MVSEARFARLLVIVLPSTLLLTYLFKITSTDSMRRDAINDLYSVTERTALEAPNVVHHYISGGGGAVGSACSDAERKALFRAGAQLSGRSTNWMLRSGWVRAAAFFLGPPPRLLTPVARVGRARWRTAASGRASAASAAAASPLLSSPRKG